MPIVYESPDGSRKISVSYNDTGVRTVEYRIRMDDGSPAVITHQHPDVLTHPYYVPDVNQDICLYQGKFRFTADPCPQLLDGDIRFKWVPGPRVIACGSRDSWSGDFEGLTADSNAASLWKDLETVAFPEGRAPFLTSAECELSEPPEKGAMFDDRIGLQKIGAGPVDRFRFLVPNGWDSYDGGYVCSPDNLVHSWASKAQVQVDDWIITIDKVKQASGRKFWKELKSAGGWAVTHIGEIRRCEGQKFDPNDVEDMLESIRILLNVATGRRSNPVLPVGLQDGEFVWALWSAPRVDAMVSADTWLDASIGSSQVSKLLQSGLAYLADPLAQNALKYAVSYYVSANADVDVEPAIGLSVSGLQLLAHHRFVNERSLYQSSAAFESSTNTEGQIRKLLNDCSIDTSIPTHFAHLAAAAAAMPSIQGIPRDGLGAAVYLRNKMVHPTKQMPDQWSIYAWAEASMVTRHYLRLAILNTLGYQGQHKSALSLNRWVGSTEPVPWMP